MNRSYSQLTTVLVKRPESWMIFDSRLFRTDDPLFSTSRIATHHAVYTHNDMVWTDSRNSIHQRSHPVVYSPMKKINRIKILDWARRMQNRLQTSYDVDQQPSVTVIVNGIIVRRIDFGPQFITFTPLNSWRSSFTCWAEDMVEQLGTTAVCLTRDDTDAFLGL